MLEEHKECSYEKIIPTLLKFFYDEDLLSEEFLLAWDDGKSKNFDLNFLYSEEIDQNFNNNSQQILKWLRKYNLKIIKIFIKLEMMNRRV